MILGVAADNALARERPVVVLPDGDDLAGIAGAEVVEGVIARDTGNAGDEQRERRRFVGAGDHSAILTDSRRVSQWDLTGGAAAGDESGIVGWRIDAYGGVIDDGYLDSAAVLEHAELFELLGQFKRRGRRRGEF